MKGKDALGAWRALAQCLRLIAIPIVGTTLIASAAERIRIEPRYTPGETMYYQIELHTVSTGKTTTPIIDPEGGTNVTENVDLLVRLDVLTETVPGATSSHAGRAANAVHMRVTYERAHADTRSDAPEFNAPSGEKGDEKLAGHSFEFTLEPGGVISNFQDSDDRMENSTDAMTALSWIKILATSSAFPSRGISIGQKWTREQPLSGAPLAGLVWHTESTYMRDEPCGAPASALPSAEARQHAPAAGRARAGASPQCAVILTQFKILSHGRRGADQTPPDYIRHGLRTSGTVTGSGESLDTFSLASGLLVRSTKSSTQRVDFDIIQAANGETIHRAGQVQSQMVITRVAAPGPPGAHP